MHVNIQTKVESAGVTTQSRIVKIDGRTFRMTSTVTATPKATPAPRNSFTKLTQNIAKAKKR